MSSRLGGMWSRIVRVGGIAAVALVAAAVTAGPAAAGGSWLSPASDRYEPGDTVTLVGYVSGTGTLGSFEDGPFFAYLRLLELPLGAPNDLPIAPFTPQASDLRLGQLALERTGRADYAAFRASLQFRLPSDLSVGRYAVSYCNSTCTKGLSDLIGGVIFVGWEPDSPIGRTWPLEEPEIANLSDDAVLYGPGWQITAREARAGLRPGTPVASIPDGPPSSAATGNSARRRVLAGSNTDEQGWSPWVVGAVLVSGMIGGGALVAVVRTRLKPVTPGAAQNDTQEFGREHGLRRLRSGLGLRWRSRGRKGP